MNNRIISRKISHVRVKNFQTHVDSFFSLDQGMNLIVGTSDSGKTALAKAINFVIYNTSDSEYVRYFSKFLEVEIVFEDGAIIKRIKGKDINQVSFKYPEDFDFTSFSAFGTTYPEEVLEFLGNPILSKVLGALSYSDQKNKLFLIDLPASVQPKIISAVIGTEDIQKGADILASDVRDYNDKIKACELDIQNLTEKLKNNYVNLDEKIKSLNLIQERINKISTIQLDIVKIENILETFISIKKRAKKANNKIKYYTQISNSLKTKINKLETLSNDIKNMYFLNTSLNNKNQKYLTVKKQHDKLKKIIDSNLSQNINSINDLISKIKDIESLTDDVSTNLNKQANIEAKIQKYKFDQDTLNTKLDDAYKIIRKNKWHCLKCNKFGGEIMS